MLVLRELLVFRCILTRIRTQSRIDANQTLKIFFLGLILNLQGKTKLNWCCRIILGFMSFSNFKIFFGILHIATSLLRPHQVIGCKKSKEILISIDSFYPLWRCKDCISLQFKTEWILLSVFFTVNCSEWLVKASCRMRGSYEFLSFWLQSTKTSLIGLSSLSIQVQLHYSPSAFWWSLSWQGKPSKMESPQTIQ